MHFCTTKEMAARLYVSYQKDKSDFSLQKVSRFPERGEEMEEVKLLKEIFFPYAWNLDCFNKKEWIDEKLSRLGELMVEGIAAYLQSDELAKSIVEKVITELPSIRERVKQDVMAAFNGDPAANSPLEIIRSYPGLLAIQIQRISHLLYQLKASSYARELSEYVHSKTGIDIHPGATIGDSFFIDHGTGVVIGETTVIGNRVRIYQGVTLGALSLKDVEANRGKKRHPTIEDEVTIYANAIILGGKTVIGKGSVIGGDVWITESVPPESLVFLETPPHQQKRRGLKIPHLPLGEVGALQPLQ